MLPLLLLLLPSLLLAAPSPEHTPDNPWGAYAADCLVDNGPELWDDSRIEQKWYTIDLDKEAHDRWREVATSFIPQMLALRDVFKEMTDDFGGEGAFDTLVAMMTGVADKMTEPYKSEIYAMADLTGIPIEQVSLLNLFYEASGLCTSLVAINHEGQVFHGRNLDFGLFYLWDTELNTWDLTLRLRDLSIQLEFIKDGKLLFKAVTFAGHMGILTGVRPGAFSVSINTRFGSTIDAMTQFLLTGLEPNQQFVLYANRDMMTNCATFEEAKTYIEEIGLLKSAYFTMGSVDGGVIVTRALNTTDHEAVINTKDPNGWYVLQTNYDWNEPDIYLDDRTIPGNRCMQKLGRKRVTKEGIFQVMTSKTTLNKSTIYTTVMEIKTGALYTFKQECKDPCWFVLLYVIATKKRFIPSLYRIILLHILLSQIGTTVVGVSHFAMDKMTQNFWRETENENVTSNHTIINPPERFNSHEQFIVLSLEYNLLSIVEYTFFIANCMLNTLHAFIRFSSICRPFQYKKSFTASLLIKQTTAIWVISVALASILSINATCYYLAMNIFGTLLSLTTISLYIFTLTYWKFIKASFSDFRDKIMLIKDEYRNAIPASIFRTAMTSFTLCTVDILGNTASLYALCVLVRFNRDIWLEDKPDSVYKKKLIAIVQITSQFRDILFPIMFIALFGKVRQLFFGRTTSTTTSQGDHTESLNLSQIHS